MGEPGLLLSDSEEPDPCRRMTKRSWSETSRTVDSAGCAMGLAGNVTCEVVLKGDNNSAVLEVMLALPALIERPWCMYGPVPILERGVSSMLGVVSGSSSTGLMGFSPYGVAGLDSLAL